MSTTVGIEMISIDSSGDLILEISGLRAPESDPTHMDDDDEVDNDHSLPTASNTIGFHNGNRPLRTVQFKVSRAVLNGKSAMFKAMMNFRERNQALIRFEERLDLEAAEIWLRVLHSHELSSCGASSASRRVVWELLHIAQYLQLELNLLSPWFDLWVTYQTQALNEDSARELLLLYYKFNKAKEFAEVTRYLAYNGTSHITERNPTHHTELRLPRRIIGALNGAKGRLRTLLCRAIWMPMRYIIVGATCQCGPVTYTNYSKALFAAVRVFPMEEMYTTRTMQQILNQLGGFEYRAAAGSCVNCSKNFKTDVKKACAEVQGAFQGLCLDCLSSSRNDVSSYWSRFQQFSYDKQCRITHGHMSWYYSDLSKPDDHHLRFQVELAKRRDREY